MRQNTQTPRVEKAKLEVGRLRGLLRQAEHELEEAQVEAADFKVGDVVEAQWGRPPQWRPAVVREVEPQSSWVWYKVSFKAKDGEWQKRTYRIFTDLRRPS